MAGKRIAVVLFNLGGPDCTAAIQPFLFNLFNDPAIIGAPQPIRWLLATLISYRRAPIARAIYSRIGGASPLLENTRAQAAALTAALGEGDTGWAELRVFTAMRYWHPMSPEAAAEVKQFEPDEIVLLPLYPQFSTTTTGSSIGAWRAAAAAEGIDAPTRVLCCYPTEPDFIAAHARLIRPALDEAAAAGRPRLLFSAHGLPKKIVERGDPYVWQIEQGAAAVAAALADSHADLDWRVCYQSRVGPLEWIGPSIEQELTRAGRERVPVVVTPIAFVSEHSETLVELDVEYREFAERNKVPGYLRVAALGTDAAFIAALAALVRRTLVGGAALCSQDGGRLCPASAARCAFAAGAGGR